MINSVILICIMLLLSAFFSGMEIAFLSRNRLREEIDRKQNGVFNFIAHIFEKHSGQYITTILVGNNICLVIYSLYMSIMLRSVFELVGWNGLSASSGSAVLVETVISTVVILFTGEFLPKSIVKNNPNFYYRFLSPIIYVFYLLLYPIALLTMYISYGILQLFGRRPVGDTLDYSFNREDLINLVDSGNDMADQQLEDEEIKLFQNALDFADLRVRDCMVSRVDVEAVDINTSIEELTKRFVDSKFSRIFVWQESIDSILGYVNSKSLFTNPTTIQQVMMPVEYVAETLPLQTLLQNFIKRKSGVAVVIDEFGGTAGIISIEDVLEQIFGDIEDEHDVQERVEKQVGEGEYVLSCRLDVEYLNERYGFDIEESDEYDTLAGYIIYNYDGIPAAGTELSTSKLDIKILRTARTRVDLARVKVRM
ncbi:MAG: HlyC/CorC family transporter [Alistipes sp.]|nr:HlyC/CorC family transporter [Alistipes sp.]